MKTSPLWVPLPSAAPVAEADVLNAALAPRDRWDNGRHKERPDPAGFRRSAGAALRQSVDAVGVEHLAQTAFLQGDEGVPMKTSHLWVPLPSAAPVGEADIRNATLAARGRWDSGRDKETPR